MASRQQEAPTSPISVTLNGNRLTVIEEGAALRDALVRLIDGARTSLKLYYYIFADDGSGRLICERLVAARARGVAVTLMIDGFGSSDTPDSLFAPLIAAISAGSGRAGRPAI